MESTRRPWISPKQWRREVTFGSYHAVEVQGNGVRKMQASSDYEPGRVLMLLEALLNPVPREAISSSLNDHPVPWHTERGTTGQLPFVRIRAGAQDNYLFLVSGLMVASNRKGLATAWQDDIGFGGKIVPKHLAVQAARRELLNADITVQAAGNFDPGAFELPVAEADPGTTLRPLYWYEAKPPKPKDTLYYNSMGDSDPTGTVLRNITDRHGDL